MSPRTGQRPSADFPWSTSSKWPTAQNTPPAAASPPTVTAAELTGCCLACFHASRRLAREGREDPAGPVELGRPHPQAHQDRRDGERAGQDGQGQPEQHEQQAHDEDPDAPGERTPRLAVHPLAEGARLDRAAACPARRCSRGSGWSRGPRAWSSGSSASGAGHGAVLWRASVGSVSGRRAGARTSAPGDLAGALLLAGVGADHHERPGERRDDPLQGVELLLRGGDVGCDGLGAPARLGAALRRRVLGGGDLLAEDRGCRPWRPGRPR